MVESGDEETPQTESSGPLLYTVEDKPPWVLSFLLGIQHYLTTVGGVISVPFILGPALCILRNDPALGYLISTIFMVSGISTLLQCTAGVRLPIIQGCSFAFISCILSLLNLPQWSCPPEVDLYAMGKENRTAEWHFRMREIQGAVISVSLFEVFIGYSGLIGLLVRFISPLTIAPTITLVGLSMVSVAAKMASGNWYLAFAYFGFAIFLGVHGMVPTSAPSFSSIALLEHANNLYRTIVTVVVFSQLLRKVRTPLPWYTISKGWHLEWIVGFQLFPVLLATGLVCTVSYVLTNYDLLPFEDPGRTDLRGGTLELVEWFRVPYPFQWGWPRFTGSSIVAMVAAVSVGIVESIGDYYACATICGKPPPPLSAINRGIGMEGVGCLIAGAFGIGPGVTSFSENIGAIGVTKVGSRRVIVCGALFMVFLSVVGKVGAVFALIPTPVVGGLLCIMFSMVTAVGLSNLQYVNLKSHRNMFVLGSAFFFGIGIPNWLESHPKDFMTGYVSLDQLTTVLLSTHIFVAASLAFILDNIIPGSDGERGVLPWLLQDREVRPAVYSSTYDLPRYLRPDLFKKTGLYIAATTCAR